MPCGVLCHLGGLQGYAYVANEMPVLVCLECIFSLNCIIGVSINTSSFMYILWKYCQRLSLWNTKNIFSLSGMDVTHEQYNMKHYNRHEIVLLHTCLLYLYLTPE